MKRNVNTWEVSGWVVVVLFENVNWVAHGKGVCECVCVWMWLWWRGVEGITRRERECVVFVGEEGVEGEERESGKEGDDVEFVVLCSSIMCEFRVLFV